MAASQWWLVNSNSLWAILANYSLASFSPLANSDATAHSKGHLLVWLNFFSSPLSSHLGAKLIGPRLCAVLACTSWRVVLVATLGFLLVFVCNTN